MNTETKEKKRLRDPRTLTVGFGSTNFEYRELTAHDWNQIQGKFGNNTKISDAVRTQLNGVTVHYSFHHQFARHVESLNDVKTRIEKWQTQTNALRNFVWTTERQPNSPSPLPKSLDSLLKRYFHSKATDREKLYPLARLARLLDGARAISQYFIDEINAIKDDNKNLESSLAWVALVISICDRNGLPVMVFHGETREFHPGFVELLDRLQNILNPVATPEEGPERSNEIIGRNSRQRKIVGRRAVKSKKLKRSSLKKLALQAYDIAQDSPAEELFVLLSYWGIGQTQINTDLGFGIDLADLETTQMRLRQKKRPHRTEKNVTQL
jgi:hypothetical protein